MSVLKNLFSTCTIVCAKGTAAAAERTNRCALAQGTFHPHKKLGRHVKDGSGYPSASTSIKKAGSFA